MTVVMLRARIDVPYTAKIETTYADQSKEVAPTSGIFTGVNAYNVVTKFEPLGHVVRASQLKRAVLRSFGPHGAQFRPAGAEAALLAKIRDHLPSASPAVEAVAAPK
jgi:hypothetical protein